MSLIHRAVAFCVIILSIINRRDCISRSKADIDRLTKDLVPRFLPGPPQETLDVVYEYNITADLGNVVYYEWLKDYPKHVAWTCDKSAFYTLIMTNPQNHKYEDILSFRYFTTWLVINIPDCNITKGYTIFEYDIPRPQYGLGRYFYLFAVFKQPVRTIYVPMPTASVSIEGSRVDVDLKAFAQNQSLGNPFAANYVRLNGTLEEHLFDESPQFGKYDEGVTDYYGLKFD